MKRLQRAQRGPAGRPASRQLEPSIQGARYHPAPLCIVCQPSAPAPRAPGSAPPAPGPHRRPPGRAAGPPAAPRAPGSAPPAPGPHPAPPVPRHRPPGRTARPRFRATGPPAPPRAPGSAVRSGSAFASAGPRWLPRIAEYAPAPRCPFRRLTVTGAARRIALFGVAHRSPRGECVWPAPRTAAGRAVGYASHPRRRVTATPCASPSPG